MIVILLYFHPINTSIDTSIYQSPCILGLVHTKLPGASRIHLTTALLALQTAAIWRRSRSLACYVRVVLHVNQQDLRLHVRLRLSRLHRCPRIQSWTTM